MVKLCNILYNIFRYYLKMKWIGVVMKNLALLTGKDEYVLQSKKYDRIDALLALSLYLVMIFLFVLIGKIFVYRSYALTETYKFCVTGIISFISLGLVFLLCYIRKQNIKTIGFSRTFIIKSFSMGMTLFLLIVIFKGVIPIISGSKFQTDHKDIVMWVIYYLVFIALMEEVVMRGYVGTRLYGYFTNKRLSIFVVGVMFSLYHIPFQIVINKISLVEYISLNWANLIIYFIFHLLFQWLYSQYNSIVAPTLFHFIWDFIKWFIIR